MSEPLKAVAEAFVRARKARRALSDYPGTRPDSLSLAYAIQDHAIGLDGRVVEGWKVGRINPPDDSRLGDNRLSGPIFTGTIVDAGPADMPVMPVFAGGFAAAEAELLLHVAPGFAGPVPETDEATRAVIDDVRLGIEIASSPYARINADGPTVTASDFGNNFGLVRGAALADWREIDLCAIPVSTVIDGVTVGEATAATMLDGPYGAVRFLLRHLAERGIDTGRGLWVSTGAITGVHDVAPGQAVDAIFGTLGRLSCRIGVAQAPDT